MLNWYYPSHCLDCLGRGVDSSPSPRESLTPKHAALRAAGTSHGNGKALHGPWPRGLLLLLVLLPLVSVPVSRGAVEHGQYPCAQGVARSGVTPQRLRRCRASPSVEYQPRLIRTASGHWLEMRPRSLVASTWPTTHKGGALLEHCLHCFKAGNAQSSTVANCWSMTSAIASPRLAVLEAHLPLRLACLSSDLMALASVTSITAMGAIAMTANTVTRNGNASGRNTISHGTSMKSPTLSHSRTAVVSARMMSGKPPGPWPWSQRSRVAASFPPRQAVPQGTRASCRA